MRFRNTIVLLVIFGLLLGYFLLVEQHRVIDPVDPRVRMMEPVPLFNYSAADIVELNLTDGLTHTIMRRSDETTPWKLVEPVQDDVQTDRVEFFVQQLASLKANRVLSETGVVDNLAEYGLRSPEVTGTIRLRDGQLFTIFVGDKTPELTDRYIQLGDDRAAVYLVGILVPNYIVDFVQKPPVAPTPTLSAAD